MRAGDAVFLIDILAHIIGGFVARNGFFSGVYGNRQCCRRICRIIRPALQVEGLPDSLHDFHLVDDALRGGNCFPDSVQSQRFIFIVQVARLIVGLPIFLGSPSLEGEVRADGNIGPETEGGLFQLALRFRDSCSAVSVVGYTDHILCCARYGLRIGF